MPVFAPKAGSAARRIASTRLTVAQSLNISRSWWENVGRHLTEAYKGLQRRTYTGDT